LQEIFGSGANYPTIHGYRGIKRVGASNVHSATSRAGLNDTIKNVSSQAYYRELEKYLRLKNYSSVNHVLISRTVKWTAVFVFKKSTFSNVAV
jgi:hypothetical protein